MPGVAGNRKVSGNSTLKRRDASVSLKKRQAKKELRGLVAPAVPQAMPAQNLELRLHSVRNCYHLKCNPNCWLRIGEEMSVIRPADRLPGVTSLFGF